MYWRLLEPDLLLFVAIFLWVVFEFRIEFASCFIMERVR